MNALNPSAVVIILMNLVTAFPLSAMGETELVIIVTPVLVQPSESVQISVQTVLSQELPGRANDASCDGVRIDLLALDGNGGVISPTATASDGITIGDAQVSPVAIQTIASETLETGEMLKQQIFNYGPVPKTISFGIATKPGQHHCIGPVATQLFNASGDTVEVIGFGTFSVKHRTDRTGVIPE